MTKTIRTLACLAILVSSLVSAAGGQSCFDGWCGTFEGGVELLYLRPSACDYGYAISDRRAYQPPSGEHPTEDALPQGKQKALDPDYSWGWRAAIGYTFDCSCLDLLVQYTWLRPRESQTFHVSGKGAVWPTRGQPRQISCPLFNPIKPDLFIFTDPQVVAQASARLRVNYDAVDLQFGGRTMRGCEMWLRGFVGLHFANIEHYLQTDVQGTKNPGQQDPRATTVATRLMDNRTLWGVGPEFGLEARYAIACGFGVGARLQAGVIAGESDGRITQDNWIFELGVDGEESKDLSKRLTVRYPERTHVIPFIDARLGINYTFCCGRCFALIGEVGYEFISYVNGIGDAVFNDDGATQSQDCFSFNLDGLYLMGRLSF